MEIAQALLAAAWRVAEVSGDLLLLAKDRKDIWNRFFLYRVLHFKSLRARAEERRGPSWLPT